MNEQFASASASEDATPDGVRTYRGRTIEELIPRIREELGPDAIILREREGLTGGIGGFFAQRCVEIDARRAQRVNIYDEDYDDEEAEAEGVAGDAEQYSDDDAAEYEDHATEEYEDDAGEEYEDDAAHPELAAAEPWQESAEPEPPAPPASAPFLDEASFAARLEEATFATEPVPAPSPESSPADLPAPAPATPAFIPFDELGEFEPSSEAAPAPAAELEPEPEAVEPEAVLEPEADLEPEVAEPEPEVAEPEPEAAEPEPEAAEPEPEAAEPEPEAAEPEPSPAHAPRIPLEPAPWLTFAEEQVTIPAASPPVQAPPAMGAPAPTMPAPSIAVPVPVPTPTPAPRSAPTHAASLPATSPPTAAPAAPAPYGHGVRRRGGLLPAAERMLRAALDAATAANERRELDYQARLAAGTTFPPAATGPATPEAPATAPAAAPAAPSAREHDESEQHRRDAEIERRLVAGGLSPSRAAAMVGAAISTRGPFSAGRELVDDVRATIAGSLPTPHTLPRDRGAVAIVGAGGSGKTRCVAAMAVARARAGGLVSVASLGAPGHEDELGGVLHGEPVNVIPAMRTRATARAVGSARERGLVIIDTAAVTPRDGATIDVIAEALRSFELDGIYLAVPATLSPSAGARLIDGFSAFDLTGLVATHVDEADQLGVIAELSMLTGIPLCATHTGLDLQNAIAAADPDQIAAQLLR